MTSDFLNKEEKDLFTTSFNNAEATNSPSKEGVSSGEKISFPSPPYFIELLNRIKGTLSAMKAFAFLSRDKFIDSELGEYFVKIISGEVEKTLSLLNCFQEYLHISTPIKKANTIHTLIEEVLTKHESYLEEMNIRIIKKQFEESLPETIVPDEQLRYILNSVIQYTIHSIPPYGNIGFLTRLFDIQGLKDEEKTILQKDKKYIEILIVSTHYGKRSDPFNIIPGIPAALQEEAIDLILQLVKEIVKRNRGVMRLKTNEENTMSFLSLVLPVERRKVVQYPSPEERLKKGLGI
jgi:hypothetical protein